VTIATLHHDAIEGNSREASAPSRAKHGSANEDGAAVMPANVLLVDALFVLLVALAAASRWAGR
jgi:hypothetical protein